MRLRVRIDDRESCRGVAWQVTAEQIREAARVLAAEYAEIDAVFLFGSRAKGTARPSSDVDFAVLLTQENADMDRIDAQGRFRSWMEERLNMPVDVLVLKPDLHPALLFDVFSVETPLFARDGERAHRVACQARMEYRDLKPRLDRRFERACRAMEALSHALDQS